MKGNRFRPAVLRAVGERGECIARDLIPLFPTMTEHQVRVVLRNAASAGELRQVRRQRVPGTRNANESVYALPEYVAPQEPVRASGASSVWDYAQRAAG